MTTSQDSSPSECAPYDPPGEVLTTETLDAKMEDGKPMLNNYVRHSKIGGGQHGEVYLCYKINSRLARGDPNRRMAVVSQRSVQFASLPLISSFFLGYKIREAGRSSS
jgi:hypothetical protein